MTLKLIALFVQQERSSHQRIHFAATAFQVNINMKTLLIPLIASSAKLAYSSQQLQLFVLPVSAENTNMKMQLQELHALSVVLVQNMYLPY